jgi:hypothetical protein
MPAPIALFVYNRPDHTQMTIDALKVNLLANESDLVIFSDGARRAKDEVLVNKVRKYLPTIEGFKSVKVIESSSNNGLSRAIIKGVNEVLTQYDSIIVLEDDLVTSPYFLSYMNQALDLYRDEENVVCVNAYFYPVGVNIPESFFLRGADCQGWATWKRGWSIFNPDGKQLLKELKERKLIKDFNYNNSYSFARMLAHQSRGLVESWAIRWYASAFLENKLTLYPGKSLIKNIGFDNTGVNSSEWDKKRYDSPVNLEAIKLQKLEAKENRMVRDILGDYFRRTQKPLYLKVKHKLLSFLK